MSNTMKETIFTSLVENGNARTAAQLAAQLRTNEQTVRARINEIRADGFYIEALRRADDQGRVTTWYYHTTPSQEFIARAQAAINAQGEKAYKVIDLTV